MPRPTHRDRLVVPAIALASILVAAPGVHLFELWLPPRPAIVVSHGLALLGLALAAYRWRRGARPVE
jgi:hypothetical protein